MKSDSMSGNSVRLNRMDLFHLVREDWGPAILRFDEAIRRLPEYAAAFEARGYCHQALSNVEQAAADYQRAIALEPSYSPTYKLLVLHARRTCAGTGQLSVIFVPNGRVVRHGCRRADR